MKTMDLEVVSGNRLETIQFKVERMINAGYVGRDRQAVVDHIEELSKEGVPPPPSVPIVGLQKPWGFGPIESNIFNL